MSVPEESPTPPVKVSLKKKLMASFRRKSFRTDSGGRPLKSFLRSRQKKTSLEEVSFSADESSDYVGPISCKSSATTSGDLREDFVSERLLPSTERPLPTTWRPRRTISESARDEYPRNPLRQFLSSSYDALRVHRTSSSELSIRSWTGRQSRSGRLESMQEIPQRQYMGLALPNEPYELLLNLDNGDPVSWNVFDGDFDSGE